MSAAAGKSRTFAEYAGEMGQPVCREGDKDVEENEKRTIGIRIRAFIFRGGGGFYHNSDVPAPGSERQYT